ncbi:MAG TPA: hypothetical protein VMM81_07455 [Acidimicrobiia bacterium]|nr:hypothetical protein [Acidimicrobiia bacterium]
MSRRRRIEIPAEVAADEAVPHDLDATQHEPYTIPSTRRRLRGAIVYGVATAVAGVAGLWLIAAVFAVATAWHVGAAWAIEVLDPQALESATREVQFPVGHASAVVGFDGIRARPVWNVLVFSADDPPTQRGLVRVDAVDGHVVESFTEPVASSE